MYALTWKLLIIGLLSCTFFLWEGQGHFLDEDQISSGEGKRKGKRRYRGEAQNKGYFYKILIKQDTKFISQTFGQTNF